MFEKIHKIKLRFMQNNALNNFHEAFNFCQDMENIAVLAQSIAN